MEPNVNEKERFFNYLLQQKYKKDENDENENEIVTTDSHRSFRSITKTIFGFSNSWTATTLDGLWDDQWAAQAANWFRGLL